MKGPWIIAVAIMLAACLIVGAQFYFRAKDQECERWQATTRSIAEVTDLPPSTVAAEKLRPEGCPLP